MREDDPALNLSNQGKSEHLFARLVYVDTKNRINRHLLPFFPDPDLISGDGLYSLHLTRFPVTGRYRVTIHVDDNENRAFVARAITTTRSGTGAASAQPVAPCCGSVVALHPEQTEKTGIFRRSVPGPVTTLARVPGQSEDALPPARIGDLRVTALPGKNRGDHFLASWTAPGGDYNAGSVASYRFVFSEDISALLDPSREAEVLLGIDRMEQAGTKASFDFRFPRYDRDYYLAVLAFDLSGNRGKVSNLVHLRVESPPALAGVPANGGDGSAPFLDLGGGKDMNWILVGAIAGVLLVLLVISLAAICYYWAGSSSSRKRRSSRRGGESGGEKAGSTSSVIGAGSGSNSGSSAADETDSSSFDSDIKNIMAIHPLGPALGTPTGGPAPVHHGHHAHHLQQHAPAGAATATTAAIVGAPGSVDSGMSSGGGNDSAAHTPVYWSASQLLSKLDHSGQPAQTQPAPAGPYLHPGPQSLQPQGGVHSPAAATGPQSLHNLSFSESLRYSASSGVQAPHPGPGPAASDWSNYGHVIPEEYTITVTGSGAGSGNPPAAKVPPPVMPKPRNITQV